MDENPRSSRDWENWPPGSWKWLISTLLTLGAIIVALCLLLKTSEQVQVSRESVQKDLRPYLALTGLSDSLPIRTSSIVDWTLTNLGKTPAYETKIGIWCVVRDSLQANPESLDLSGVPGIVLGSGVPFPGFSDVSSIQPQAKRPRIFLYGRITYEDVFGTQHYMNVCYEYIYKHQRFLVYPKYNDADR